MALSWWGKRFMANLHASLESTCKSGIWKISTKCQMSDAEHRNVSFALISFMGFPTILNASQPFQICIKNSKYSKLTFWEFSQLMGKRFMVNLHASLESTCKSGIWKISTKCQMSDAEFRNVSFALISFTGFSAISNALQPFQICIYNSK